MLHVWNISQQKCPKNHPNVSKYTIHGASWSIWDSNTYRFINFITPIDSQHIFTTPIDTPTKKNTKKPFPKQDTAGGQEMVSARSTPSVKPPKPGRR